MSEGSDQAPVAENAANAAPEPGGTGQQAQRRSPWVSSLAAIKYILQLGKRNDIQFRASDKITTYLVAAAIFCWIGLILCPVAIMPLAVGCDILLVAALVNYVANRLGILTTLPPRTAALVTELMCGICMITILTVMNFNALFGALESMATQAGMSWHP